ncbi:unnamed protein product [Amaranthus hypochondriacus]
MGSSGNLVDMLHVITEKLDKLERKNQEIAAEKERQSAQMNVLRKIFFNTSNRINEMDEGDGSSVGNFRMSDEDWGLKIDLPEFDGIHDSESFLEWLRRIETVFEYKGYDDKKKFKLVVLKFIKLASLWYDNFKANRRRAGKENVDS